MTSLSLPFFSFDVSAIRTAYYPGASLFLDGHLSKCSKRFRAVSGKERGTRARSSDCGDRSVFQKAYTGKTRGALLSFYFSSSIFRPISQAPGSVLSRILLRHPARSKLTGSSAAFFSFFCLFLFFVLFPIYVFFFLLVIVTFLRFVVSSSPVRITLDRKQTNCSILLPSGLFQAFRQWRAVRSKESDKSRGGLPRSLPRFYFFALLFTSHRSPLSEHAERLEQATSLHDFCNSSRDTSCDGV